MNDDEVQEARVSAALRRLAAVVSDKDAPDAELDAAVEVALRTPGVREELQRRAALKAEPCKTDDPEG